MRAWLWGSASSSFSSSTMPEASGSSLSLEDRLHRVTANDIARVTPSDVEQLKQKMSLEDLHRAMRVLLEDNRYAEVLDRATPSSLRRAAHGLSATQRSFLLTISKSNLLALYNVLPHVTESHLAEMNAIFRGAS
ncbi:hypothetical protein BCY84_19918 [Trypanosoma cruzi cruzi]|nr:hypothetical protein BCY84_19918 [Trypanosoma cruzi cruzi]